MPEPTLDTDAFWSTCPLTEREWQQLAHSGRLGSRDVQPALLARAIRLTPEACGSKRTCDFVVTAAAKNVTLTPEQQVVIARHPHAEARKSLAANSRICAEAVAILVEDPSPRVLRNLYKRRATTAEQRERILARLQEITETTLDPLIARFGPADYATRVIADGTSHLAMTEGLKNAALTGADLRFLWLASIRATSTRRPNWEQMKGILAHPNFPLDVLADVAVCESRELRRLAALSPRFRELDETVQVEAVLLG